MRSLKVVGSSNYSLLSRELELLFATRFSWDRSLEFLSTLRSFSHCSYGREVSKEQFINHESLLVPSSDGEDGASRASRCLLRRARALCEEAQWCRLLLHLRNMKKLSVTELISAHLFTWSAKGPEE